MKQYHLIVLIFFDAKMFLCYHYFVIYHSFYKKIQNHINSRYSHLHIALIYTLFSFIRPSSIITSPYIKLFIYL